MNYKKGDNGYDKIELTKAWLSMSNAEAYVGGILRGGYLIGEYFCFHAGGTYIRTKDFRDLKILDTPG